MAPEVARGLLGLAARQHGVVSGAQLTSIGLSDKTVAKLCAQGWIRRIIPGAYAVGGRPPSRWERVVAVALLNGEGSAISHATAAAIHRMPGVIDQGPVELTVVIPRHPRPSGTVVHRVRRLDPGDTQIMGGLTVTTPARTLVDLSSRLDPYLLANLVDEGRIARLWTVEEVLASATRAGPRSGIRALRSILGERLDEPRVDSMLEGRVVRALSPFAPFETQYQVILDGQVVILDVAWPVWKVGVESDGWSVRSRSRSKFDQDRRKGNLLAAHGWTMAHVTSAMSDDEIRSSVGRLLPMRVT